MKRAEIAAQRPAGGASESEGDPLAAVQTRERPLTLRRPKPLVPVAGRPIIEHIIGIVSAGMREVCLVIGYGEQIVEHLGDGRRLGRS